MNHLASLINYAHEANLKRDYEYARQLCKQALKVNKTIPECWYNLGIAERGLKQTMRAIRAQREALQLTRNSANAQNNIGLELLYLGEYKDAESAFRRAIRINPQYALAYSNIGKLFGERKNYQQALEFLRKACLLEPDHAQILCNLGAGLNAAGCHVEAETVLQKSIALNPQSGEAHSNLGVALTELNRYTEAEAFLQKSIALDPQSAEAYSNLGGMLSELNRYTEAEAFLQKSIALDPQSAEAYSNLGGALSGMNRYVEAEAVLRKAISLDPQSAEAHNNLGHLLLRLNRFSEGWPEIEYRDRVKNPVRLTEVPGLQTWNGKLDVDVNLVIHSEQGIGDEILFSIFFQQLNDDSRGAKTHITTDKRLLPIYRRSFPNLSFSDKDEQFNFKGFNAGISLASCGQFFLKDESNFSEIRSPHLLYDKHRAQHFRNQIRRDGKLSCGVSWFSIRKENNLGEHKSLHLTDLEPILSLEGFHFVNLQYGDVADEIAEFENRNDIKIQQIPEIDNFKDIDDLMSLVAACDLVVTVSNVTAHLAGAIGKKAWQISPRGQGRFWYWENLNEDNYSLWYPSVKIFEQEKPGQWQDPIKRISLELLYERNRNDAV